MSWSRPLPFSPAAERAIRTAQGLAAAAGESEATPVHLLLGVLLEQESRGPELLRRAGVDVARLTARLMAALSLQNANALDHRVALSGETRAVLRRAQQAAAAYPPQQPGTEHLLQAVLRHVPEWHELLEAEGVPVRQLMRRGELPDDYDPDAPPIPLDEPAGERRRRALANARLYVLIQPGGRWSPEELLSRAAQGGAQVFQLRAKALPDRELLALARRLARLAREHDVLLLINDRPDIALLAEADGVHVGQDDLPPQAVHSVVGSDVLVGISTHSVAQAQQAEATEGVAYIGVGPVFRSSTKHFNRPAGLELVQAVCPQAGLPAFAIGGIDASNIGQVLEAGARRVAVCGAIASADDPQQAAATLREHLDRYWA